MALRLQESDTVILGCVHSHEIPEKTHPLLVFQACQAKLGNDETCAWRFNHSGRPRLTFNNHWKLLDKWEQVC